MNSNNQVVEDLRWKKFPVLSDGFVTLVDVMGDDQSVVQAARVSYGKDKREDRVKKEKDLNYRKGLLESIDQGWNKDHGLADAGIEQYRREVKKIEEEFEKERQEDRTLLRYLMRHRHTTPFEMAEVKILVRVPMDCWRQWIRHRTANVNEYSTRYTEAIDAKDVTPVDKWRLQSDSNKQGSSNEFLPVTGPEIAGMSTGENLSADESYFHREAERVYRTRLRAGVAREQARKDLPLSTYTEAYWKCDLHNILGFLALRMDSHAQQEIRQYATIIGEKIIKPLFPMVWEAFEDYRLGAMTLTRLDVEVILGIQQDSRYKGSSLPYQDLVDFGWDSDFWPNEWRKAKCRERDECIVKLKRLGLVTE